MNYSFSPDTESPEPRRARRGRLAAAVSATALALAAVWWLWPQPEPQTARPPHTRPQVMGFRDTPKPNHQQVRATVFWVGEPASPANRYISNTASAWVSDWISSYGGIDDPKQRCGLLPCGFTPRENSFYFALPFNDYTPDGRLKSEAVLRNIPWYEGQPLPGQSLLKNHWITITHAGKTAYAQWQDVGPFGEDDIAYVFGDQPPQAGVGLDLSPAAATYLGINGQAAVSWRFVEASSVPAGPWKEVVTTGGLRY